MVGKNQFDTAYDVGSVVQRLSGRRLGPQRANFGQSSPYGFSQFDGTGCLEGGDAADTSIRPTCFFEEPIIRPLSWRNCPSTKAARTAAGYVFVWHPKSQYRLSKSSDSFG
ncbi:hypothetical protein TNCV_3407591 [Trichonephila clavipes]|uniref:Uncharacterized protein n=1 Tax=Trichonephila clavipes TaxID=2585209 RepID=A0A8X6UQA1_TRICX|nr:hypothetical protein TNCV_3407591 [Trichonephila clavipes]